MKLIVFLMFILCAGLAEAAFAETGVVRLERGEEAVLVGVHIVREEEARKTIETLLAQKPVQVFTVGTDRRGRALVQLYTGEGKNERWVQGELLRQGLAFVVPQDEGADDLIQMMAIEKKARAARVGLWGEPAFTDVSDTEAARLRGAYGFVVGRVSDVSEQKKVTYLNFGDDWKTDFSVLMTVRALKAFKAKGRDVRLLKGKRIRVRGFVDERNGPMIVPMRPEAIEVLEEG